MIPNEQLLNNEWFPITFYAASDPTILLENANITYNNINITFHPIRISSSYNSSCVSDSYIMRNNIEDFTIKVNLLDTTDIQNCIIQQTGFSP